MPLIIGLVFVILLAIIGTRIGKKSEEDEFENAGSKIFYRILFVAIIIAIAHFGFEKVFLFTRLFASGILVVLFIIGAILFIFFPPIGAVLEVIAFLIAVLIYA